MKHTEGKLEIKNTHIYCDGKIIALSGLLTKCDDSIEPGESWLDMRARTKPERDAIASEVKANVKRLVHCWNNFDEVMEALELIKTYLEDGAINTALNLAKEAIEKAE